VKKGFKIIGRNYGITFGDLDIIARKNWGLKGILLGKRDKTIHI